MKRRRNNKRKKHKEIWRVAGELGLENKGYLHRNHRTKVKKCGLTYKKEKLIKYKNEEWVCVKTKLRTIIDEE